MDGNWYLVLGVLRCMNHIGSIKMDFRFSIQCRDIFKTLNSGYFKLPTWAQGCIGFPYFWKGVTFLEDYIAESLQTLDAACSSGTCLELDV